MNRTIWMLSVIQAGSLGWNVQQERAARNMILWQVVQETLKQNAEIDNNVAGMADSSATMATRLYTSCRGRVPILLGNNITADSMRVNSALLKRMSGLLMEQAAMTGSAYLAKWKSAKKPEK